MSSLRDSNYRFPDSFISHIGKINVVCELIRGSFRLDFQPIQSKPDQNDFWMYCHSYRSKLDDNLIKRNVETQFTNEECQNNFYTKYSNDVLWVMFCNKKERHGRDDTKGEERGERAILRWKLC